MMALRPFSKIKLVYISSKINRCLSFTVIYKIERKARRRLKKSMSFMENNSMDKKDTLGILPP